MRPQGRSASYLELPATQALGSVVADTVKTAPQECLLNSVYCSDSNTRRSYCEVPDSGG